MPLPVRHTLSSTIALAALAFAAVVAPAGAQTARDLTPQQNQVFESAQPKPSSLAILTLLDRANATYGLGEVVRLAVKSNEDAFVTVLNIGPTGRVTRLFPNAFQTDNRIKAGETLEIPSSASGTQIKVSGPVGAELIKVIATSRPMTVIAESHFAGGAGVFRSLEGGVEALNRDLAVAVANPPPETRIAVANQIIKTVASAPPQVFGGGVFVVPTPTSGAVLPVVGAPGATFPLLLATDKRSYKVGERLTIAVTPLRPCHLSVYSADQAGKVRLLFPSAAMPTAAVNGLQTVMISGGPAPQNVVATGPGAETLTAICTSEPRPVALIAKSASDYLSAEDKAGFDRDLAVVPTRPADTTGFAQAVVTIEP